MLKRIKEEFSNNLFDTIIHLNVKLKEAQNQGSHIIEYNKYCRGAKDYFSLSREIIAQEESFSSLLEERRQAEGDDKGTVLILTAPEAKEVFLTGDFNHWQVNERSKMEFRDGGSWVKRLQLKPGAYKYRFVVDGQWRQDPQNPHYQINHFGLIDSLLEIKEVSYGKKED